MLRQLTIILCFLSLITYFIESQATPREIIIVRHADKLAQDNHGPALAPTGYERAVHLAFYILKNYGNPDYLIAANPNQVTQQVASIRELQTLAPLANLLQQKFPQSKVNILDPYTVPQYPQLAHYLLTTATFNNKLLVVCWDHHTIPKLVNDLGVKEPQPIWPGTDFDSVYILKFTAKGQLESYQFLHNQYPVKLITEWRHFL